VLDTVLVDSEEIKPAVWVLLRPQQLNLLAEEGAVQSFIPDRAKTVEGQLCLACACDQR